MVPLVFALLPDKKQSTYLRLFTILKQKANQMNLQLQPNFVFTDFETAAQNAAKIEFPCQIKGCMFHFRQAVWKNVQRCGLQVAFQNNPSVNRFIRHAAALPLIRICDIEDFWLHALESVDMDIPGVRNFADYVTEQWVEGGERFMWNHFDTFVNLIKSEQNFGGLTVMQLNTGGSVRPKKKVYRQLEER
ncbi:uncharacterized protein LOC124149027 [Haliotis rufescens]|uniref:uncharacterized protein LOC124149027 n=1 Tax=Haliotis rufescens TaxID=6454 RepID=UPI001EB01A63|nr:uncharacterized protein LOC124149027 [Haliotis rufescens]